MGETLPTPDAKKLDASKGDQNGGAIAALKAKYEKSLEQGKLADQIRDMKDENKLMEIGKILGLNIEQSQGEKKTVLEQKTADYENAQAKNAIIDAFVKACEKGEEEKINQIKNILEEGGVILTVTKETEKFMKDQLALKVTKKGVEGIDGAKPMIVSDGKIVTLTFEGDTKAVEVKVTDASNQKWQMILTNKDNSVDVVNFEGKVMVGSKPEGKARG